MLAGNIGAVISPMIASVPAEAGRKGGEHSHGGGSGGGAEHNRGNFAQTANVHRRPVGRAANSRTATNSHLVTGTENFSVS